jgi:hypothetical protein
VKPGRFSVYQFRPSHPPPLNSSCSQSFSQGRPFLLRQMPPSRQARRKAERAATKAAKAGAKAAKTGAAGAAAALANVNLNVNPLGSCILGDWSTQARGRGLHSFTSQLNLSRF